MSVLGLVAWLLSFVAVWVWLARIPAVSAAERVGLSVGLGASLTASAFFVSRWLGVPTGGYVAVECMASVMAFAAWVRWREASKANGGQPPVAARRQIVWPQVLLVAIITAASLLLWREVLARPHGGWDAWAIWNPLAAYLAQPGEGWLEAITTEATAYHTDYPLLLPATVARAWVAAGSRSAWIPAIVGVGFTAATALIVVGSIGRLRGPAWATASGGLLLVPELLAQGANQMADVPLGFFLVTAVVLCAGGPASTSRLIAAGLAAGSAAWTKNEGLVAALAIVALFLVVTWRRQGRSAVRDAAADLTIGLMPLLVLLALFKLLVAPPNDLAEGVMAPGALRHWSDGVRVSFVAREMVTGLSGWGGWPGPVAPLWLVAVASLWPRAVGDARAEGRLGLWLVAVMLVVFFVVYVMTPHSVAWHMQTSWTRLVTQLWPTLVWGAIASSGVPRLRDDGSAQPQVP